jgi:SAM-dependent methyltransferase
MPFRYMEIAQSMVSRFLVTAKEKNIWAATTMAVGAAKRHATPAAKDSFDVDLGVETSSIAPLWQLKIPSENAKFGIRYQTTDPSVFLTALHAFPVQPQDFTYLDLGCGKGRTLILAAREGFKRIMGVEFSPELAAIARKNLSQVGIPAEVIEADASQYRFPDGNLLIYLYNPFGCPIVEAVIRNLILRKEKTGGTAIVVYANPVCHELFESTPAFEPLVTKEDVRVWRLQ